MCDRFGVTQEVHQARVAHADAYTTFVQARRTAAALKYLTQKEGGEGGDANMGMQPYRCVALELPSCVFPVAAEAVDICQVFQLLQPPAWPRSSKPKQHLRAVQKCDQDTHITPTETCRLHSCVSVFSIHSQDNIDTVHVYRAMHRGLHAPRLQLKQQAEPLWTVSQHVECAPVAQKLPPAAVLSSIPVFKEWPASAQVRKGRCALGCW